MKRFELLFGIVTLTLTLAAQVHAQSVLTNGLVAYYPFNGNANDESGNGNNGTIIGYDWAYGPDRFGGVNSLYLNVTSTPPTSFIGAQMIAPRSALLDFNKDFTLSVWVNLRSGIPPISPFVAQNFISNGSDATNVNLRILSNFVDGGFGQDALEFVWNTSGGVENILHVGGWLAPVRDTWWQTTVVRSGTNVSLFKNGGLFLSGAMVTPVANSPEIWIGRYVPYTYPLIGGIDDVRMYNRALSLSEVQQLYAYESGLRVNLIKAVKPSFTGLFLRTNYQMQVSSDMNNWTNQGLAFTATNASMIYPQYFDVENWNSLFFRLQVAP